MAQLKSVIEQRSSAPVDQQTLYFQEQVMHNDSVLSNISGLNHGGMVYLSRRHFSLTIYNWLSGSLEKVQLKLSYSIMVMVCRFMVHVVTLALTLVHMVMCSVVNDYGIMLALVKTADVYCQVLII